MSFARIRWLLQYAYRSVTVAFAYGDSGETGQYPSLRVLSFLLPLSDPSTLLFVVNATPVPKTHLLGPIT